MAQARRAAHPRFLPDRAPAAPSLAERLGDFRSLGGNCEFGFVQRYGGAEPSGLFRFSYTPIDDLIHALATDFAEYGAPGDLLIAPSEGGTYYCRSRRYNIWSNTAQPVGSIDPDALLEREYGRVSHLKRKMLKELAAGSKILVRKVAQGETGADFDALAQAICRHGPSTLLRVTEAGPEWTPEPVRRKADRILDGSVRRFAPTERAWDLDLEPWVKLCESAYAMRHGIPDVTLGDDPSGDALKLPVGLRRHAGRHPGAQLNAYTKAVDPAAFDPAQIYVFSTWVWVPEACAASRIFAAAGLDRLGWRDADLSVRRRWQRVWAAGRFRHDGERAPVGLGMIGRRKDRFWSWGAVLHEGPIPRQASPPAIAIEPMAARWLSRWWT